LSDLLVVDSRLGALQAEQTVQRRAAQEHGSATGRPSDAQAFINAPARITRDLPQPPGPPTNTQLFCARSCSSIQATAAKRRVDTLPTTCRITRRQAVAQIERRASARRQRQRRRRGARHPHHSNAGVGISAVVLVQLLCQLRTREVGLAVSVAERVAATLGTT
jgi:hypothetical protein